MRYLRSFEFLLVDAIVLVSFFVYYLSEFRPVSTPGTMAVGMFAGFLIVKIARGSVLATLFFVFLYSARKRRSRLKAITELLVRKQGIRFFIASAILGATALMSSGEIQTVIICAIAWLLLSLHLLVTIYRVRRGYFGSNAAEITELISFIIQSSKRRQPPDGTPLSVRLRSPTVSEIDDLKLTEGVRAS